jgi:hypothetical protein
MDINDREQSSNAVGENLFDNFGILNGELIEDNSFLYMSDPSALDLGESRSCTIANLNPARPREDEHQFLSPLPWIQHWSAEHVSDQDWGRIVDTEALKLPKFQTIQRFLRLYFIHFHPSYPVVSGYQLQLMIGETGLAFRSPNLSERRTISLVILNAILFVASGVRCLCSRILASLGR